MRILLAEVDNDSCDIFTEKLKASFCCLVEFVSSGNKTISLLNEYDILISDNIMEDSLGLDLLSFKIKNGITIPFIFFTSTIDPEVPFSEGEFLIIEKSQFKFL